MRELSAVFVAVVSVLTAVSAAVAAKPAPKTFVAVLTAAEEVPPCGPATNAARGVAVFHVVDEATGTVRWKLVANNLPGNTLFAHIHVAPPGEPGPIVQGLDFPPGAENGVIGTGTFTNPQLLAAIRANPDNYYVNVHTDVCRPGVIRGQLGDHGPAQN